MPINTETNHHGRHQSATKSPSKQEPIIVTDANPKPLDVLASAYGSCLLKTIGYAARKKQFEVTGARSEIMYEMNEDNSGIGAMNIKIFFGKNYTDEQKQVIEQAAKKLCHVGNSLNPTIFRMYEFNYNSN